MCASNALWKTHFGTANDLEECWPEAAINLRHISITLGSEKQSFRVCTPGASASASETVQLHLTAMDDDGAASLWLLMVTESGALDEEAAASRQLQIREAERDMDGVALRMQERHWRAFFHEAAGKSLIGLHGETLEVNRALCELLDRSEQELLYLFARDLRHPDDRDRVEAYYQAILDGEPSIAGVESRYLHKDGCYLDCLLSLSLIRDSRGRPLYFAAEIDNITSWRQAQASLRNRTRQLEETNLELTRSNTDLERFAFVVSHDLQEPLRKIRVFGDRLTMLATDSPPDVELVRYVEAMTRSAERMQNLIEDLLAFGRLRNRNTPKCARLAHRKRAIRPPRFPSKSKITASASTPATPKRSSRFLRVCTGDLAMPAPASGCRYVAAWRANMAAMCTPSLRQLKAHGF